MKVSKWIFGKFHTACISFAAEEDNSGISAVTTPSEFISLKHCQADTKIIHAAGAI